MVQSFRTRSLKSCPPARPPGTNCASATTTTISSAAGVCGLSGDVDCTVRAAPCLTSDADRGFAVDEAEITWWGLRAACRQAIAQQ
jgi:hypothetical protein